MNRPVLLAGLGLAGCLALAGCSAAAPAAEQPSPAAVEHTAGMVMPDGSTMGAAATATPGPSPAALMVCSDDVRGHLAQALRLPAAPAGTGTWADRTYTCRYQLPMGPLVLSVVEDHDAAASAKSFAAARTSFGATRALIGLTQDAYGTDNGIVVLRKDNDVLEVDASKLPAEFGPERSRPDDFAYEIASDVLGCWTGGE